MPADETRARRSLLGIGVGLLVAFGLFLYLRDRQPPAPPPPPPKGPPAADLSAADRAYEAFRWTEAADLYDAAKAPLDPRRAERRLEVALAFDDAATCDRLLREFVTLGGSHSKHKLYQAFVARKKGQIDEAKRLAGELWALDPADWRAATILDKRAEGIREAGRKRLDAGLIASQRGNAAEAFELLGEGIALWSPEGLIDTRAWAAYAQMLLPRGDAAQARALLDEAIENQKDPPGAWFLLRGVAHLILDESLEALEDFDRAGDVPATARARAALNLAWRESIPAAASEIDAADPLDTYEDFIMVGRLTGRPPTPKDGEIGQAIHGLIDNDLRGMAKIVERLASRKDARAKILAAEMYLRLGEWSAAERALDGVEVPSDRVVVARAVAAWNLRGPRSAIRVFDEAPEGATSTARARLARTALLVLLDEVGEASETLYAMLARQSVAAALASLYAYAPNLLNLVDPSDAVLDPQECVVRSRWARLYGEDADMVNAVAGARYRSILPLLAAADARARDAWRGKPPDGRRLPSLDPELVAVTQALRRHDVLDVRRAADEQIRRWRPMAGQSLGFMLSHLPDPVTPDFDKNVGRQGVEPWPLLGVLKRMAKDVDLLPALKDARLGLHGRAMAARLLLDLDAAKFDAALHGTDPEVLAPCVWALAHRELAPATAERLRTLTEQPPAEVQHVAAIVLGRAPDGWASSPDPSTRAAAMRAGVPADVALAALDDSYAAVRRASIFALGRLGGIDVIRPLAEQMKKGERAALEAFVGAAEPGWAGAMTRRSWERAPLWALDPADAARRDAVEAGIEALAKKEPCREEVERYLARVPPTPEFLWKLANARIEFAEWIFDRPVAALPRPPPAGEPLVEFLVNLSDRSPRAKELLSDLGVRESDAVSSLANPDPATALDRARRHIGGWSADRQKSVTSLVSRDKWIRASAAARLLAWWGAAGRLDLPALRDALAAAPDAAARVAEAARDVYANVVDGRPFIAEDAAMQGGKLFPRTFVFVYRPEDASTEDAAGVQRRLLDLAKFAAPRDLENLVALAALYEQRREVPAAVTALEDAELAAGPRAAEARMARAQFEYGVGDAKSAIEFATKALDGSTLSDAAGDRIESWIRADQGDVAFLRAAARNAPTAGARTAAARKLVDKDPGAAKAALGDAVLSASRTTLAETLRWIAEKKIDVAGEALLRRALRTPRVPEAARALAAAGGEAEWKALARNVAGGGPPWGDLRDAFIEMTDRLGKAGGLPSGEGWPDVLKQEWAGRVKHYLGGGRTRDGEALAAWASKLVPNAAFFKGWEAHQLYVRGEFLKAAEAFKEVADASTSPEEAREWRVRQADALIEGKNVEAARAVLKEILDKDPAHVPALLKSALASLAEGKLDDAIRQYDAIVALGGPRVWEAHNQRGATFMRMRDFAKAQADFKRVTELAPDYGQGWSNYGAACLEQGQLDEAVAALKQATTLDPTNASPYRHLGRVHLKRGMFEEARIDLTRATQRNPKYGDAYADRARAYLGLGKADDAEQDLKRAEGNGSTPHHYHEVKALLLVSRKKLEEAVGELVVVLQAGHPRGKALLDDEQWESLRNLESFRKLRQGN